MNKMKPQLKRLNWQIPRSTKNHRTGTYLESHMGCFHPRQYWKKDIQKLLELQNHRIPPQLTQTNSIMIILLRRTTEGDTVCLMWISWLSKPMKGLDSWSICLGPSSFNSNKKKKATELYSNKSSRVYLLQAIFLQKFKDNLQNHQPWWGINNSRRLFRHQAKDNVTIQPNKEKTMVSVLFKNKFHRSNPNTRICRHQFKFIMESLNSKVHNPQNLNRKLSGFLNSP